MSDNSEVSASFEFCIVGVMITMVSMVGIFGNIICILMFQYKQLNMNQTFASLLKWLAAIDSVFLVSIAVFILLIADRYLQVMCFFVFSLPVLSPHYKIWIFPHILPTVLPLTSISLTGNIKERVLQKKMFHILSSLFLSMRA